MNEKAMVVDTLTHINSSLEHYGSMIAQTQNQKLRQTLIQARNASEVSQYELYDMAKQHGYYHPAQAATKEEIQEVRSLFEGKSMLS
ncbi:MAG: spore coat protein [Lachnospiraceae bacterium]|nr:spore coat protein [Lachnospiraceae bacterium]